MPVSELFTNETQNIISDVLADVAGCDPEKLSKGDEDSKVSFYACLENIPYTNLIIGLSDALEHLGYVITKK